MKQFKIKLKKKENFLVWYQVFRNISLLGNILANKGAIANRQVWRMNRSGEGIARACCGNKKGRGLVRAGHENKMDF